MLKKRQKLSRSEFENLLKKGKRIHNEYMTLVFLVATNTKAGVVVSKKTARKAVLRNVLRRRVFSTLKDNIEKIKKKHIAVILKTNCSLLNPETLKENTETLLSQIK